jgi:hypothetical protein
MLFTLTLVSLLAAAAAEINGFTGFTLSNDGKHITAFDLEDTSDTHEIKVDAFIQAIDYRAFDNSLYGLSGDRVLKINICDGSVEQVGNTFVPPIDGSRIDSVDIDFNPDVNRLRIIGDEKTQVFNSTAGGNLVGTLATVAPPTARIAAIAYTNNVFPSLSPAVNTTLFGLDHNTDELVTIAVSGLAVAPVAKLTIDVKRSVGFDIFFNAASLNRKNRAFILNNDRLYEVNLASGVLTGGHTIGDDSSSSSRKRSTSSSSSSSSSSGNKYHDLAVAFVPKDSCASSSSSSSSSTSSSSSSSSSD